MKHFVFRNGFHLILCKGFPKAVMPRNKIVLFEPVELIVQGYVKEQNKLQFCQILFRKGFAVIERTRGLKSGEGIQNGILVKKDAGNQSEIVNRLRTSRKRNAV